MSVYKFLAWTSPGLQKALIEELKNYNIYALPNRISIYPSSSVFFNSTMEQLHQLLYKPSCITYLNLRLNKPISARNPREFLKNFSKVQLHPYIPQDAEIEIKLTSKKSYFNHSVVWKDVFKQAIVTSQQERKLIAETRKQLESKDENEQSIISQDPAQPKKLIIINAYLYQNYASLYIQLHSQSLHKHGMKENIGKAALGENVASALLHFSKLRSRGNYILWDPFCGCGTIILCALTQIMNKKIREHSFDILTNLPIYKEYNIDYPEEIQIQMMANDKDAMQYTQFLKNLSKFKLKQKDNRFPPHLRSKSFENLDVLVMDYQGVYQNYLRDRGDKKLLVISNPPWNSTIKFNHFEKMLKFLEGTADECYLVISKEQMKYVNQDLWSVIAEPLLGGKWTRIIHYKKGELVKQEDNKSIEELSFIRDIQEYKNDKIVAIEQHIDALKSKLNNNDYLMHIKSNARQEAKKYGDRLTRLHVGKKTKIRQLMIKRREEIYKRKIRNLNLQLQKLKTTIHEEQIELKKQEVKNKLLTSKFKLDNLNEEQKHNLQQKLDKMAKVKSIKLIKQEKKRTLKLPKW